MNPRWKTVIACGAVTAAVGAGCRRSESPAPSASPAPTASAAAQHPPFGFLDSPRENDTVASGSTGVGWALDDSGIAAVTVSLDNGPAFAATRGQTFPGVKEAYPTFPGAEKSGFSFAMPSVAAGPHLLVVTITARDGGKTEIKRHVQIK